MDDPIEPARPARLSFIDGRVLEGTCPIMVFLVHTWETTKPIQLDEVCTILFGNYQELDVIRLTNNETVLGKLADSHSQIPFSPTGGGTTLYDRQNLRSLQIG